MHASTITLPTGTLECAWWGEPSAARPTLVLLHEGLGCVALWRDFPARLAAATGCAVFAYSRFGYGASDPCALPRPLNYLRREAVVLTAVLDAVGIGRAILVGHSDGASIAAIATDPRIAGIILIAPHYFVEASVLPALEAARTAYEAGEFRARLARYHHHVDVAFRGWSEAWLDPGFRAFDLTAELAAITVPVLQLQGTDDPYGTSAQTDCADRLARAETVLLPARHAPHLEAPEASMAAIRAFVARIVG